MCCLGRLRSGQDRFSGAESCFQKSTNLSHIRCDDDLGPFRLRSEHQNLAAVDSLLVQQRVTVRADDHLTPPSTLQSVNQRCELCDDTCVQRELRFFEKQQRLTLEEGP